MSDADADDGSSTYTLSAHILTTAILSVAFVVVLLVVLHFYIRCILRRSLIGRRGPNITLFRVSSDAVHHTTDPRPTGLDRSAINALPTFPYQKHSGEDVGTASECPICLSAVDEGEMVRVLPNCKHLFHVGCVDMWLHSHSTCPVCRATVEPGSGSGDSGLVSRLGSSLRWMMSRDRSGRRVQADESGDLERQ